ncbi:Hypothetical predicted protein [Octopus vulgaris]|uniref:Uncharacterized protein n=1 Tax=Octopus vulgaris TaxID=6645 RepID=A0AA36BSC4_OCTVU|nr:Hypothetical predicted protein [Octopus vulgaris]
MIRTSKYHWRTTSSTHIKKYLPCDGILCKSRICLPSTNKGEELLVGKHLKISDMQRCKYDTGCKNRLRGSGKEM